MQYVFHISRIVIFRSNVIVAMYNKRQLFVFLLKSLSVLTVVLIITTHVAD